LGGVKRFSLTGPLAAYGHLYKMRARFNLPGRRLGLGYERRGAGASFPGDGLAGIAFLRCAQRYSDPPWTGKR
jgi:hypothetical protein